MATATKPPTKSEVFANIATATELSRKQVASVFEALSAEIKTALGKKGAGVFAVPGLMKITVKVKPATKAGMAYNPFKKIEEMRKAKPASRKVKVRPLKALNDFVK